MDDETLALTTLVACGGPVAARRALLDACGSARAALDDRGRWPAFGLTPDQTVALRSPVAESVSRTVEWLAAPGHRLIGWIDADYPPALRTAPSPPLAVLVAGDITLLWQPSVAVVGTRAPTPAGRENAGEFAAAFGRAGLVVGSGLAAGIDAAAHQAALAVGAGTFAVLGTGPDVAYPRSNATLHAQLESAGALVSEHLPGTGPRREHFPTRNRLLAALCLGTVVIEAAERSGALITARLAAEAGREVFAVPGSIRNPLARGCHRLIREGATLVESPAEVVAALARDASAEAAQRQRQLFCQAPPTAAAVSARCPAVAAEHKGLWDALGFDPSDMDQLVQRTRLTPADLAPMLLALELDGHLAQQHGRFHRVG